MLPLAFNLDKNRDEALKFLEKLKKSIFNCQVYTIT